MTPLTTSRFEQLMSDMAMHYSQVSRTRAPVKKYELPRELLDVASRSRPRAETDPLSGWKNRMKTDSTDFSRTNQGAVTDAAHQYKKDRDSDGFSQRIDQQSDEGRRTAHQDIDDWKQAGTDLGRQHPDQHSAIIQAFNDALHFFTNKVVNSITDFLVTAVETLLEWIVTAFEVIGPYFAELVGDIAVFFLAL